MSEKEHDMTNDSGESVTYTLRNIPAELDRVISELAISVGKPKATFLREFLESSFHDVIDRFSILSPLVATLDDALASELGTKVSEQRYQSHFVTRWNREYQELLQITTVEDARRVLMNNTPYLRERAIQVMKGWAAIPRGIALTFALFAEMAGRDKGTIDRAWNNIFYSQLPEARHRFYRDVDVIRALKKQHAVCGFSWTKDDITVRIYRPDDYGYGAWRVLLVLDQSVITQTWNILFPELDGRRFTTDPGYDAMISTAPGCWDKAFRFVDGICELHLYSNGVEEDQNPSPLPAVAEALINAVVHELL
ncbi:hypothetical protein V5081_21615 [Enterobacter cancerogenus]|uniref:hypothetical protein n=1 Tax=Enterobacter cancerogenus TaxID=69218 RepID=UPI0030767D80